MYKSLFRLDQLSYIKPQICTYKVIILQGLYPIKVDGTATKDLPKVNPANPSGLNCVRIGSTKKLPPAIEVSKETLNLLLKARDDVKKQETLKVQAVAETSQVVKIAEHVFCKKIRTRYFLQVDAVQVPFQVPSMPLKPDWFEHDYRLPEVKETAG